jgi:hypothetical protein
MQRVFEMPAIARSYYDPMILSAILRWLQPHEAWWGTQARDEHNVIHALLERATIEHRAILLPEPRLESRRWVPARARVRSPLVDPV